MSSDYFEIIRQIGQDESVHLSRISRKYWEHSCVNRKPLQFFKEYCLKIQPEEVIFLFRGLVLAEKHLNLSGGSVASTVYVLQILNKILTPAETYEQIAWALQNRGDNPYTPLGSLRGEDDFRDYGSVVLSGCKKDFLFCFGLEGQARNRAKKMQLEIATEKEKSRKLTEKKNQQETRNIDSSDRARILRNEITKLELMGAKERLWWLVNSDLPIPAVPEILFDIAHMKENYSGVPPIELIENRIGKYQKHWMNLLRKLKSV